MRTPKIFGPKLLYKLVKAREKAGNPAPTLGVVAIGDFDYIEQKLKRLSETA